MKVEEIRQLVKIVEESEISDLEVSRWGRKVRISKYSNQFLTNNFPQQSHIFVPGQQTQSSPPATAAAPKQESEPPAKETSPPPSNLIEIKSPMVGTFYRSPAPDAEPYVSEGDIVSKGQVLCIIEAMKLMNEIEAELPCRIVEILVDNSQPVEYNQPLFRVEKT